MIKLSLIAGVLGTCVALVAAGGPQSSGVDPVDARPDRVEAQVSAVLPDDQYYGVTKPSQMAELTSLVAGTISQVHVQEGRYVKKGTVLVTLDDRVPRARLNAAVVETQLTGALKRAQVELRMAEQRLDRLRSAAARGAGTEFEIEVAEGERDRAEASLEQQHDTLKAAEAARQLAEVQLEQFTIRAPFDGMITEVHQKAGAIDPTEVLITMANLDQLEVEMHLPSHMFGRVRMGQSLSLQAGVPVRHVITGSVLSVSPVINAASNTFRCLLKIDNRNLQVPAGFQVVITDAPPTAYRIGSRTQTDMARE